MASVRYLQEDGTYCANLDKPAGMPARDYVLPEGVRISIQDCRGRVLDYDEHVQLIGESELRIHGNTARIVAVSVEDAYKLLESVDRYYGVVTLEGPVRARFRDFWQELWGKALERIRNVGYDAGVM